MGITIAGASSAAGLANDAAAASTSVSTALQAQVQSAQTADVEALFGSIGLGAHVNSTA